MNSRDVAAPDTQPLSWRGSDLRLSADSQSHDLVVDLRSPEHTGQTSSLLEHSLVPSFGRKVVRSTRKRWNSIVAEAAMWVESAIMKLAQSHDVITAWFGRADEASMQQVRRVLSGIVQTLKMLKIRVGTSQYCRSNTTAYVVSYDTYEGTFAGAEKDGQRYVIHICSSYWSPELFRDPSSKYGTLVHEAAHHHGAKDTFYQGATPYGRAQCLRMAREAPDMALNNADNYKWFVYYVNRCSGLSYAGLGVLSPCQLIVKPARAGRSPYADSEALVEFHCSQSVQGATLRLLDKNGKYIKKAADYGTLNRTEKGEYRDLGKHRLPEGTNVKFFFEVNCTMWEASTTWRRRKSIVSASLLFNLAPPAAPETSGAQPRAQPRQDKDKAHVEPDIQVEADRQLALDPMMLGCVAVLILASCGISLYCCCGTSTETVGRTASNSLEIHEIHGSDTRVGPRASVVSGMSRPSRATYHSRQHS